MLVLPALARADDVPVSKEAAALCRTALTYAKHGDFDRARQLYDEAYDRSPEPMILLNRAIMELKSGHELDALQHFRTYVQEPAADKGKVAVVESDLIPKAYAATGHLALAGSDARIIAVDGAPAAPLGAGQAELDVVAGTHVVRARHGSTDEETTVNALAGTVTQVTFVTAPPAVQEASAAPAAPAAPASAPAVDDTTPRGSRAATLRTAALVTGATGIAVLAVGAGFQIAAGVADHHAHELRSGLTDTSCTQPSSALVSTCNDLHSSVDARVRDWKTATTLYAVGGVVTFVGVVSWVLLPRRREAGLALSPYFVPGNAMGTTLTGRF